MDANPDLIPLSALCLFFLMLSAFFSASETALFSIPRERIDTFQKHASRPRRLIYALLTDGQRTLLLLLLCNLFTNITLAGLINSLTTALLGRSAALWSFLAATAMIITFGEVLPKNAALRWNEAMAAAASPVLHVMKALASPLLNLVQRVNQFFLTRLKIHLRQPSPFITIDELKSALRSSVERGVISRGEQGVITNLLDKGAQPVKRFMTHRSQLLFIPHYTSTGDAVAELARRGQTFAIITRGQRGRQVLGVALLPDLLRAAPAERCRVIARSPQWAPETLEAAELVSFMFAEKQSVVCVVDEFGGLSGVFTLSDSLSRVMNFRRKRAGSEGGNTRAFTGLQELDGMAGWLPESLAAAGQSARTLNGALTRHIGRIPKTGERFDIDGWNFYIMDSGPNRIESVLIGKKDLPGTDKQ
jgi:CBS domain containing-hemolysin-like protein